MKDKQEFAFCEQCNKPIPADTLDTPQPRDQYEAGLIQLGENSTMLLPASIVEKRKIVKLGSNHAVNIDGYYCNRRCLMKYLLLFLKGEI